MMGNLFHSIRKYIEIIKTILILDKRGEPFDVREICEEYRARYHRELSPSTVRRVLKEMLKEDMVKQVGYGDSTRGRRPTKYLGNF